jgi:hypothetical protein
MESVKRFGFSAVEKNKIWRRWKVGQSIHEIGRAFDEPHSSPTDRFGVNVVLMGSSIVVAEKHPSLIDGYKFTL